MRRYTLILLTILAVIFLTAQACQNFYLYQGPESDLAFMCTTDGDVVCDDETLEAFECQTGAAFGAWNLVSTNEPCSPSDGAPDADNDGVLDSADVCPGFDDTVDVDNDDIPDGCDSVISAPAPLGFCSNKADGNYCRSVGSVDYITPCLNEIVGEVDYEISCPYGCTDPLNDGHATCVGASASVCTDSDGGLTYDTLGTVVRGSDTYTDVCLNTTVLRERSCTTAGYIDTQQYNCAAVGMVCQNGVCVSASAPLGFCSNKADGNYCRSNGSVDYITPCLNEIVGEVDYEISCPYGCTDPLNDGHATCEGASASLDSDNDGYLDTADNCPLVANADQANLDGDTLGDVCDDATCVDADNTHVATDTTYSTNPYDNRHNSAIWNQGSYSVFTTTQIVDEYGDEVTSTPDACQSNNYRMLQERYCAADGSIKNFGVNCDTVVGVTNASRTANPTLRTCLGGKCVAPPSLTSTCVDSDRNLYFGQPMQAGNVTFTSGGSNTTLADTCTNTTTVREYLCTTAGSYANQSINCASFGSGYTCSNGACINASTPTPSNTCVDADNTHVANAGYTLGTPFNSALWNQNSYSVATTTQTVDANGAVVTSSPDACQSNSVRMLQERYCNAKGSIKNFGVNCDTVVGVTEPQRTNNPTLRTCFSGKCSLHP